MQISISDWAWIQGYPGDLGELKRRLTITPKRTSEYQAASDLEPMELFCEDESRGIGIPRAFLFQNANIKVFDRNMSEGSDIDVNFSGDPVRDQGAALSALLEDYKSGSVGGVVHACPAWGKTVFGLMALSAIGKSTVIVVHREFLMNQWINRIKAFLPSARVGIIRGKKCEHGDKYDISIAMLQSISGDCKYPLSLWSWPGLVITDEVHRLGARVWSEAIVRFNSRYRLGLSATVTRSDGMHRVFFWHMGKIIYRAKEETTIPYLRRIMTDFRLPVIQGFDINEASKGQQLGFLISNPARNGLIVQELKQAVDSKRKIIVLSERIKHLEILKEQFDIIRPPGCNVDFYIGGRSEAELEQAEAADVIFATFQMAGEALDIPSLDTLFLASPMGKAEQFVGRIRRASGKTVVVDFVDRNVPRFMGLFRARMKYYKSTGIEPEKKGER